MFLVDAPAFGVRCRRLPGFLSCQYEVGFETVEVTAEALWKIDTGGPDTAAAVHMAKAINHEVSLEACNAAHEVHAGQGGLIEYGIAARPQISGTQVAYFGDPRWHKRRIAEVLE